MDRTNIIRNRIADLRSEKYAYLAEYLEDLKKEEYEFPESDIADEWNDLLNYLENQVLSEGLEYNVAEEQSRIDFAKIYTGESLREYIYSIPDPEEGDKAVVDLTDYLNFKLPSSWYNDGCNQSNMLCYIHDDYLRPALPVIAKCIKDQGEEELYRSALIVLDYEKILKTCIEEQDRHAEYRMFCTLKYRLEALKYYGYDRIYLHNVGPLREIFVGENLRDSLRIPYLCLGVRIIMSGRLSYFVQYAIRQNDQRDEENYGDFIVPQQLDKYRKMLRAEDLPQLTPEEARHVENIVLFTAREVFYTDELLTYQSQEDPWWNRQSKYTTKLKYNTSWFRTWKFPSWMIQLIEFYILHTLLSVCDTGEVRERIKRYKDMILESLPEQFHDKSFTGDPYEDPIFELVRSTGIISEMDNTETNRDGHYAVIPEVAAYYLQKARSLHLS